MKENVAVIGAGFYGLVLSTYLAKKYNVTIFEEESDGTDGTECIGK